MNATTLTQTPVPSTHRDRGPAAPLTGLGTMVRFVLRRNRIRLAVWWLMIVGLFAYVGAYYHELLNTQQALDDFAALSDVPSIKALSGLAAAPATLGGAVWTKIWMTCVLMLAFAVIFLVTRNGRADEEAGRTELLRSRALGLHAYTAATWTVTAGLCVAVGAGISVMSIASGLDPVGAGITGSLVLGASVTGVGLVSLGVAAVTGQVTSTSRAANAQACGLVGAMYAVRMVGDLGSGALTWASPIGWGQQMAPWGADRWWPLLLSLGLTTLLLLGATRLETRRDLGSGLLRQRPGPASAQRRWTSPLGLALHLERGVIAGWTLTVVACGLLFGSVIPAMNDLINDSGVALESYLRGSGMDALLSLLVTMMAMITTVFAMQTAMTLRIDEASGILEAQLAGAVSRVRWAGQRLLIPSLGSAALLALGGGLLGFGYASATGDNAMIGTLLLAALAYWPAVMVLTGITVALFGWLPRATISGSWAVVGVMWVTVVAGDALRLPSWLLDVLPLSATPYQPLETMAWTPLIALGLVAAGLFAVGLFGFRRRDVAA